MTGDDEVMGEGSIDFTSIMPDTKLAGAKHIYVEQRGNFKPNSMSCVKRSARFVKDVLYKNRKSESRKVRTPGLSDYTTFFLVALSPFHRLFSTSISFQRLNNLIQ